MAVRAPNHWGLLMRKTPVWRALFERAEDGEAAFPQWVLDEVRDIRQGAWTLEDEHLMCCKCGWSFGDAEATVAALTAAGLRETVDFAYTLGGWIKGRMPPWAKMGDDGYALNLGTPILRERDLQQEHRRHQDIKHRKHLRERFASRAAGLAFSYERWHDTGESVPPSMLSDCWALVQFVERSRQGGPARTWVEQTYPDKRWSIHVCNGYRDELSSALVLLTSGPAALRHQAERRVRRRAGEYLLALHAARGTTLVDIDCFEAWRQRMGAHQQWSGAVPDNVIPLQRPT